MVDTIGSSAPALGRLQRTLTFDLNVLVKETCSDAAASVPAAGLEFELQIAPRPLPVRADPVFVSEAIKNLIDNARKHGGAGLTRVEVRTCADADADRATLAGRDDGAGLSPDETENVFSRFSQLEPSDGCGLGLAIASSVAERPGGTLRIDAVSSGASLTLALPLAQDGNRPPSH